MLANAQQVDREEFDNCSAISSVAVAFILESKLSVIDVLSALRLDSNSEAEMSVTKSDSAAKSAVTLPITKMKTPATEYIPGVSQFCLKEWQDI